MRRPVIVFAILIFLINLSGAHAQQKELTVETIYNSRTFSPAQLRGLQWFDNGRKFTFLKFDPGAKSMAIYLNDVASGDESVLISGDKLKTKESDGPFTILNYSISPDENYILFTGVLPARRLKTGGAFYIYDIKAKKFFLLAQSEKEQENARFSPDGKKLGFVRGNNLFIVDIATDKETQLTFDGSDVILNGRFDWVYEEEFSIINGWEWSSDSRSIAYWRLDQSRVPEINIAKYDSLYFNFLTYRYPKPGAHNSLVKIGVVDISSAKTNWMDLGSETDIYIPRIKFTANPEVISIQKLNRLQNHLELLFCNTKTGKAKTILEENAPEWINIQDDLTFLKDGKRFLWSSERDGYMHLYLYDYNGKLLNRITGGSWALGDLVSVDEKENRVYYTSNERGRCYKDLYSIKLDETGKTRVTEDAGSHSVNMSPDCKTFIDRYSTINIMPETYLCKNDGSRISTILSSDSKAIKEYGLSKTEFFTFRTSDSVELNAFILKPANFDESKKYPVVIMQYNGPGAQFVNDSWGAANMWDHLLSQKGYIIVGVDSRITDDKVEKAKKWAYRSLGKWEVNDLIETAKYLKAQSFVDGGRIGIWGWSYGGYTSASAILRASDYFKAAIAVAPVTSWRFYDSIYTERYMSLPSLNPEGYEESAPLNYADRLKGKFLLIHGMADDNVHFQNSVELVNKLIAANKQFSVMYYPGRDHGIYGGNTRIQLYTLMTDFFLNNL